jgi:hypothetical protein
VHHIAGPGGKPPKSTKHLIGAEGQFRTCGLRRNDAVIEYDATTEHGHYDG